MTMGEKILNMRKARGWSQEELAEHIGVTRQAVSRWEAGTAKPDADKIIALCDLFGVSADYLLRDIAGGQEQQTPPTAAQQKPDFKPWLFGAVAAFGGVTLFILRILASVNRKYIAPTFEKNMQTGIETYVSGGYYTGFRYYIVSNGLDWLVWLAVFAFFAGAGTLLWRTYRARKNKREKVK